MIKVILWIITIIVILFLLLRFYIIPTQSKLPSTVQVPTSEQENNTLSQLSDCPDKPNCVSSTASNPSQRIEAIKFTGSTEDAIKQLATIVTTLPKSQIQTQSATYLHVVFKSPLMNFVDDTEFLADETSNLIQVRSAARLGHSDLEKNRQRIEQIRQKFE